MKRIQFRYSPERWGGRWRGIPQMAKDLYSQSPRVYLSLLQALNRRLARARGTP